MASRKLEVGFLHTGTVAETRALIERVGMTSKYLCGSCGQLRAGPRDRLPTQCGGCGSLNIDVETDLLSQRLEQKRLGEDYESIIGKA